MLRQQRDVLAPLAQRRRLRSGTRSDGNRGPRETGRAAPPAEVAVGRGDHADVDRAGALLADALELALLQHAQQLGLQLERHLADLVEKQRAAVGQLEAPGGRASRR